MRPRHNPGTLTQVTISIDDLELAAVAGWRACESGRLGDWLLRAAEGFTGRANSALAVGDPGLPLASAIEKVRGWYSERGLPAMIAVAYPTGQPAARPLDRMLAGLGWTIRAEAATVMTAEVSAVAAQARARPRRSRSGPSRTRRGWPGITTAAGRCRPWRSSC